MEVFHPELVNHGERTRQHVDLLEPGCGEKHNPLIPSPPFLDLFILVPRDRIVVIANHVPHLMGDKQYE